VFNNTTSNPENPNNPPVTVQAGTSTFDEMLFDGVMTLPYENGDELIDIESIIGSDPLLAIPGSKERVLKVKAIAYPNPFRDLVTFSYLLNSPANVSATITDILGRPVATFEEGGKSEGLHEFVWEESKVPPGIYFYKIKANDLTFKSKLIKIE
jgi:hypothetical protein